MDEVWFAGSDCDTDLEPLDLEKEIWENKRYFILDIVIGSCNLWRNRCCWDIKSAVFSDDCTVYTGADVRRNFIFQKKGPPYKYSMHDRFLCRGNFVSRDE